MNKFIKVFFLLVLWQNLLNAEEISLVKKGGVYHAPVMINESIKLDFVVDSGAARVSMPYDVFRTLIRTGTISKDDILGKEKYRMANGEISEGTVVNIRSIKIGNQTITNILASIDSSMNGMLLLGQTALQKLEPWYLDTNQNVFYMKENIKKGKINNQDKIGLNIPDNVLKKYIQYSVKKLSSLCNQKDKSACLVLGKRYWSGKNTAKDYSKARIYFAKACDLGVGSACENLAYLYKVQTKLKFPFEFTTDSFTKNYFIKSCNDGLADGCFGLGSTCDDDHEYDDATKHYLEACGIGSGRGCYQLALRYRDSYGNVEKNHHKANKYFKKSCNLGYKCYMIGTIFEYGSQIKQDDAKAIKYYRKACDNAEQEGCDRLNALEEKKNDQKLCDSGNFTKCYNLGLKYAKGKEVKQDYIKARNLWIRACDGGIDSGCYNLGLMYAEEKGMQRNYLKAVRYFKKSCDQGNAGGCQWVGLLYGTGQGVKKDHLKEEEYYKKACGKNFLLGCTSLGIMYVSGKKRKLDYTKAKKLFTKACDGGNPIGCSNLGHIYFNGQGVNQDYRTAVIYYKKACDSGGADGCSSLALMYSKGQGVKKNVSKGVELVRKACDFGDKTACLVVEKYKKKK